MLRSNLEGGVRVASFMSGGFLPPKSRGASSAALIATADWLGTFASLAGVDPTDSSAAAHGLPPIDSVDQAPIILGHSPLDDSLRDDIVLGGVLVPGGAGNPRAIISVSRHDIVGI